MNWLIEAVFFVLTAMPMMASAQALAMRLPGGVEPLGYRLALTIDPDQASHSGEVWIGVDVKAETRSIRLHASDIAVAAAELRIAGASHLATARALDGKLLELSFDRPVPAGKGELKIAFSGRIDDKGSQGLFRQKEGGDWYVFTQFEASDARRAFPAFDEPGWKVPWKLALTIPQSLTAVANTPSTSEVALPGGMKRIEFAQTPPLPSYLVAFGVGPFDILDAGNAGRTPLRFVTPRGRSAEARYAARVTPAILAALEDYFGLPYPYAKLDVMALPLTLNFGAMENPGLVTFSSRLLLARAGEESVNFKRSLVSVQAHELAHQWFGDYVTMAWWDDLWLNESFASWMADKITARVVPEWHSDTGTQQARARAMRADRLASARRVHQPVNDADALQSAFDSITYSKGQVTLAMFEAWLGSDRFQAGVQRYISRHAWGNATGDDFVAALSDGDAALSASLRSFTEQPGIARLQVTLVCDGKPSLKLAQARFLPLGSTASSASVWQIPVTVRTPGGQVRLMFGQTQGSLALPDADCPAWVEANAGGSGYYRPVYGSGQLLALMTQADLTVNELLANLDDAQALTESGDLALGDALALALRYARHSRREVVDAALSIISRMEPLIAPLQREAYAALWQRAWGARARELGLTANSAETDDDRLLRARWIGRMVDAGSDQSLRARAGQLAQSWLKDRTVLDAADRGLVLRSAAIGGDRALFDALVAAALSSPNRRERSDIYGALGRFKSAELALAGRQLWLSPRHDIRELLASGRDQYGDEAVADGLLAFLRDNFAAISARLPSESVARFPRYFSGFCSAGKAAEVEQFFAPLVSAYEGGASSLKQTLEGIRLCAVYSESQRASLSDFLRQR
ncbi:MAG: M1 family metallopeptidase [Rhodoferax sp.]